MSKIIDTVVGVFMLAGILGLIVLAFKVSGLHKYESKQVYHITAMFDNVGGLRVRSPLRIAGVRVGEVSDIALDPKNYKAKVTLAVLKNGIGIPTDSALSILTEGLLGTNYVGLTPGFDQALLKEGDQIQETHPAIVLESLIGHFLYQLKSDHQGNQNENAVTK